MWYQLKPLIIVFCFLACATSACADEDQAPYKFDSVKWHHSSKGLFTHRSDQFDDFIRHVKLVGMSESEVVSHLGKPDRQDGAVYVYTLENDDCGDVWKGVEISIPSDGKVSQYRHVQFDHKDGPWITKN